MARSAHHAANQARYAAKLKEQKTPRADDIGRAMLKAAARCAPADMKAAIGGDWHRMMVATVEELEAAGFERHRSHRRLRATLNDRLRRK